MKPRTITITLDADEALDLLASLWYSLQRLEGMDSSFRHNWGDIFDMTGDEALDWFIDIKGISQPCLRLR
jgi:hypothetical protein